MTNNGTIMHQPGAAGGGIGAVALSPTILKL